MRLRGQALWRSPAVAGDSPFSAPAPEWVAGDFEIREGHIYQVPATGSADVEGWIVPGLVDVHCHIGIKQGGFANPDEMLEQARINHRAGVLLVRDCGSPSDNSHVRDRADTVRLVRAGRHLAKPKRYIRGSALELVTDAQLPAVMLAQARAGDGWVKLVGDWIDRADGAESDLRPLWDGAALREGVAAVHEVGGRVTVHSFAHATIDALLDAGVDCIEHGTGMDSDQIRQAAAQGIAITPTLLQVALFDQFAAQAGDKFPVYRDHMLGLQARHEQVLADFLDAGVQLLPGTDAGGFQPHGLLPQELLRWRELGLSDAQILDLGSWRARDYLGFPSLSEGAMADLVVYASNPAADISVLARPIFTNLGVTG
ncbi:amidohydrolase family protein [Gleimia coleocanis DSM 15436]|uniref:Amidohydrolase family protein n=1 Tax=Gleimia coleocanis DSM 15436 TaxID=525245 RepID=C0W177_9ACTO|nr:amidohydrolase family protein [Gleimia coleocanis]EEH63566.1 amidohydrolase family protein [Gleimia coleocanis DSM 15436]